MTAPALNTNAMKHGLYAKNRKRPDHRLILNELKPPYTGAQRTALQFRRHLEDAVQERHGTISIYHASLVNTATLCYQRSQCCAILQRNLETEGKCAPELWLQFTGRIVALAESRDRAIKALRLGGTDEDEAAPPAGLFESVKALPALPDSQPVPVVPDAPQTNVVNAGAEP